MAHPDVAIRRAVFRALRFHFRVSPQPLAIDLPCHFKGSRPRGAKALSQKWRVARPIHNQPKLIGWNVPKDPKTIRYVSSSSPNGTFSVLRRPKPSSDNRPKSVMRRIGRRLHLPPSRKSKPSASLGLRKPPRRSLGLRAPGLRAVSLSVPKPQHEAARVSESLPPTIFPAAPKCREGGVRGLMRTSRHGPGERHATRKLMAPPLRFFVLSAYLRLGNRCVPLYLAGTLRSQGFSPSQRFHPPQA